MLVSQQVKITNKIRRAHESQQSHHHEKNNAAIFDVLVSVTTTVDTNLNISSYLKVFFPTKYFMLWREDLGLSDHIIP